MNSQLETIAENCMQSSYEGTSDFPTILGKLAAAGFESYFVDYRKNTSTYYLTDGDYVEIRNPTTPGKVATVFSAETVKANVRKSQANKHSYRDFCENVKAAGCAGYFVSLLGKRVVYYGRSGESHVELMPS